MLNRVMGDVHGAIIKCWPEVAGTLGSGRQTTELCFTSLAQFPRVLLQICDLSVADPVFPGDTGGITVQWPFTGRSFN